MLGRSSVAARDPFPTTKDNVQTRRVKAGLRFSTLGPETGQVYNAGNEV
jgi:hypothetical protein